MDARSLSWVLAVSFLVVVSLAPLVIPLLRRFKFGQTIRSEGPMRHQEKSGTPTMGGIVILAAVAFTAWRFSSSPTTWLLLLATAGFGLIGLLDDSLKILRRHNLGLTARQKLMLQVLVVILFYLVLYVRGWHFGLRMPLSGATVQMGFLYLPFLAFLMVGTANAVNITDGLDGLAAGTTAIAFSAYAVLAWLESRWDVSVFSVAMVGALLGFLVFNRHPARVFMGDTGSLALGGALAAVAVLTRSELWLILIGGVFVIEALSVIIQVVSYQSFGRRVFRMSPLHHHFELAGWSEWRVVASFWLVSALLCSVAVYLYMRF